jgi:hypothetical protein
MSKFACTKSLITHFLGNANGQDFFAWELFW